jgi:hypothetical protein
VYYPERVNDVRELFDVLFTIRCIVRFGQETYIMYVFYITYFFLVGMKVKAQG